MQAVAGASTRLGCSNDREVSGRVYQPSFATEQLARTKEEEEEEEEAAETQPKLALSQNGDRGPSSSSIWYNLANNGKLIALVLYLCSLGLKWREEKRRGERRREVKNLVWSLKEQRSVILWRPIWKFQIKAPRAELTARWREKSKSWMLTFAKLLRSSFRSKSSLLEQRQSASAFNSAPYQTRTRTRTQTQTLTQIQTPAKPTKIQKLRLQVVVWLNFILANSSSGNSDLKLELDRSRSWIGVGVGVGKRATKILYANTFHRPSRPNS